MENSYVFLACVVIALVLRGLVELYNRSSTFLHRLIVGFLQILCLAGVNILMVVTVTANLEAPSGAAASGLFIPIVSAAFTGMLGMMLHFMNLIGESRYHLSEKEKAELNNL